MIPVFMRTAVLKTARAVVRNAPKILMGIGTTSSLLGLIFAVKASPAAMEDVQKAEYEKAEALTPLETAKACWKRYIPAGGMEALALICFWSAYKIDLRRQAVLAGLCTTAQEALCEYQRKVKDIFGEEVHKEIGNAVSQSNAERLPAPPDKNPIPPGNNDRWCTICTGGVTSPYFLSNYVKIKEAENDINHEMLLNMYASESDLYWLLDPDRRWLKTDGYSGQVGWDVDKLLVLEVRECDGPDHEPIYVISYKDKDGFDYIPQPTFSKLH